MKNKLHAIIIIFLIIIISLSAASCDSNPFKGTWIADNSRVNIKIVFTDNTFSYTVAGNTTSGTYSRDGNTAVMTGRELIGAARISGKTLTMGSVTFTKQ